MNLYFLKKCSTPFIFILLASSIKVNAQVPVKQLPHIKEAYKNVDAVKLYQKEHWVIEIGKNNTLQIKNKKNSSTYILSNRGRGYADEYIYHSSFSKISDISAYIFLYDANKKSYKKTSYTDLVTEDRFSASVFYDDDKITRVVYPLATVGSFTQLSFTEEITEPNLLGSFYFADFIPALFLEIKIEVSDNVQFNYSLINPDTSITYSKTQKKGKTIYTWTRKNIPAYTDNKEDYSISYYIPHLKIWIGSYTDNTGKTVTITHSTKDLYNWYYSMIDSLNLEPSLEIKKITDSLTNGISDTLEKAKKLYYWVQDHIKYVAFEDGYSGFIPRESSDVIHRRYGDCKDMSALLVEMFKFAGIPCNLAWIGTRDIPYNFSQLPIPSANHMIAVSTIGGTDYFLDATSSFQSIYFPTSFIQNKEALISINKDLYRIVKVPEVHYSKNISIDSSYLQLNPNGDASGTAKLHLEGLYKTDITYSILQNPVTKYKEILSQFLERGSNKFSIDTFFIKGTTNRDTTFAVDYTFTIPGYSRKVLDKVYINLNLNKQLINDDIDTLKQKYHKQLEYSSISHEIVCLEIPDEYTVQYIPQDLNFDGDLFSCSLSYNRT
ncbi:MAG: transglutaminase domain-containing protein, partial [Bacteroidales bacterium]